MPRNSSDAPEVVPQLTDKYIAEPPSLLEQFSRKNGSYYQKQVADVQTPGIDSRLPITAFELYTAEQLQKTSPYPPGADYVGEFAPEKKELYGDPVIEPEELQRPSKWKRRCTLKATILLVILALIIGAAIAGGVAGSIAAKKKKSSSTNPSDSPQSSTTTSAPPSSSATPVTTVDAANCPLSNGTVYNSKTSGSNFRISCGFEILPADGAFINVANEAEATFDSCLDYCASFNANTSNSAVGGCVAATWVIFSPTTNIIGRCYLKNATGVELAAEKTGQKLVSGYLLKST